MYNFLYYLLKSLIFILNGRIKINGSEKLPENESYVIVAPHKSWIDPIMIAISIYPEKLFFMAKKELFSNKFFSYFLTKLGAFPVDRKNPGTKAIKYPVKVLKESNKSLLIFPTGSRDSNEIKKGAILISNLSKKKIYPIVYDGPKTLLELLKREKIRITIKDPIDTNNEKLSKNQYEKLNNIIEQELS